MELYVHVRLQSEKVYIDRRANVIYTLVKGGQSFQAILVGLLMLILLLVRILLSHLRRDSGKFSPAMAKKLLAAFRVMWVKAGAWARSDKLPEQKSG